MKRTLLLITAIVFTTALVNSVFSDYCLKGWEGTKQEVQASRNALENEEDNIYKCIYTYIYVNPIECLIS